jgi:formylglycine-generating enzyme required for sulfatase activity
MKLTGKLAFVLLLVLIPAVGARGQSPANETDASATQPDITARCVAARLPETACRGVTSNDEWTPLVQAFDGVDMVLVPAGCFEMGNTVGFRGEQPVHEICFEKPFWIDRTEVTVDQFAQFLNGQDEPVDDYAGWLDVWAVTGPPRLQLAHEDGVWSPRRGQTNHPLESVTWAGAAAYCAWRGARLPGEAEWEFAARGPDSLLYPWGDDFVTDKVVRATYEDIPQVGSKPQGASWVGALDMSSSLFEWVHSLYVAYPYDATDGREASLDADSTHERVLRGGSWYHPEGMHDDVTSTARFRALPHLAAAAYGFRCARSLDPGEMAPAGVSRTRIEAKPALPAAVCLAAGLPANACTGVSSNDEWAPVVREFDGTPMVLVPAGCFTMGSTEPQIEYALTLMDRRGLYEDEQPSHQQCFRQPFWIDLYEVTNGRYGSYGWWRGKDQPRESVPWFEADAYCRGQGGRLPTEVEWEYAARGPDNLLYPWGNTFDGTRLNFCDVHCLNPGADFDYDDGYRTTAPVGSYPTGASWVGAMDMCGNVWEWVSSIVLDYPYDPRDGREVSVEQDSTTLRGVRGGARLDPSYVVRAANRNERPPTQSTALYGFRCARSFDPSDTGEAALETGIAGMEKPPDETE